VSREFVLNGTPRISQWGFGMDMIEIIGAFVFLEYHVPVIEGLRPLT
jgi:hypothetical protein